jgi:hypothetical protein
MGLTGMFNSALESKKYHEQASEAQCGSVLKRM